VPHDRPADGAAHHETGTRADVRRVRNGGKVQMHHESGAATTATPADGRGELVPPGEPGAGRQHRRRRIRPRAARGPYGGDRRGSRARPGCASAAGSRACAPGGDCSAGRCACPCSRSTLPVDGAERCRPPVCWCWTVVRDGGAVVVPCRDPAAAVIALVRGGTRRALVGTRPSADTVDPRVRSAVRGGQTAPDGPVGSTAGRGE
jgi:hypothetical protein